MAGEIKMGPRSHTFSPMGDQTRNLTSSEKRTFKEKLQSAIVEAEQAEQAAYREAQMQDKKTLAVTLLIDGKPQAFVDFFRFTHVSHGQDSGIGISDSPSTSGSDLPQESLLLLKSQLSQADAARRAGRVEDVYTAYKNLAKYFAQLGRLRTAEFFFKQCLNISKDAKWLPGELEANLALGVVYEELHETAAAIACHERRLELASQHDLQAEMETAFNSLATVYMGQAEDFEKTGDPTSAMDAYNCCLRAADKVGDMRAAAKANHRLGMLYYAQSKWQDTMYFLRKYIELTAGGAVPGLDKAAEGVAHTTYAQCLKHVGDRQGAIQSLQAYLQTTSRGQDPWGPAYASCSLGLLYFEQADYQQATAFFERFFEVARTLPDKRALEAARFNLGVARGALRAQAYMTVVNTDLPKLIAWKNSKAHFNT